MKKLRKETKKIISKNVGLEFSEIAKKDAEYTEKHIEKKIGKTLEYKGTLNKGPRLGGLIPRGNVFVQLNRFIPKGYIEKRLSKI